MYRKYSASQYNSSTYLAVKLLAIFFSLSVESNAFFQVCDYKELKNVQLFLLILSHSISTLLLLH